MKIINAKIIVCSPSRNFVTLKIFTDQGIYGLGDATLNGREKAVVSYLEEYCVPCLIGKDPFNIEDIWHYFYRGVYWRRGPVTMMVPLSGPATRQPLSTLAPGLTPTPITMAKATSPNGATYRMRLKPCRPPWRLY